MISIMWFALGIAATLAVLALCAKSYDMGIKEGYRRFNNDSIKEKKAETDNE